MASILCVDLAQFRAYSHLKKLIYVVEKAALGQATLPNSYLDLEPRQSIDGRPNSEASLLNHQTPFPKLSEETANTFFTAALDEELAKILKFYDAKTSSLSSDLLALLAEIKGLERIEQSYLMGPDDPINSSRSSLHSRRASTVMDQGRVSTEPSRLSEIDNLDGDSSYIPYLIWASKGLKEHRRRFEQQLTSLFLLLNELRDYVEINETGFSKVLKKYEKVVGATLKQNYLDKVSLSLPFQQSTRNRLDEMIESVVKLYARIATDGKYSVARTELRNHLREHIVWERNTIWRDMIEQERRTETIGLRPHVDTELPTWITYNFFNIPIHVHRAINIRSIAFVLALIVLIAIPFTHIFPNPEANNCLAILMFCSILWAFEPIPLFVTAAMVPLLVVLMRVRTKDDHGVIRLSAAAATKVVFSEMFSPVIMLLLGGFALAGALSKQNIAKSIAVVVLRAAGTKPKWVLLANMLVSTFMSMWISNVAAPVLSFSLIAPLLRNLPHKSPYAKSLVLGIALAANVGGMASPIASPQNIIALGIIDPSPSWIEWFVIALPVCLVIDFGIWMLLLAMFKPTEEMAPHELYAGSSAANTPNSKVTSTQLYVIVVSLVTIGLWCAESAIEGFVGDMGIIAILPILAFYGTGILTKDDWNSMLWSVVMLAMGGTALGKAVNSSGLLTQIANGLNPILQEWNTYTCLVFLALIILIVTTFISHTVGAFILLPVVNELGQHLPEAIPRTLVMASVLLCSGGMGLPVSSFPNMNAISLEDPTGLPWLEVSDFIRVGVPSSIIAWATVISLGYGIMSVMRFG